MRSATATDPEHRTPRSRAGCGVFCFSHQRTAEGSSALMDGDGDGCPVPVTVDSAVAGPPPAAGFGAPGVPVDGTPPAAGVAGAGSAGFTALASVGAV